MCFVSLCFLKLCEIVIRCSQITIGLDSVTDFKERTSIHLIRVGYIFLLKWLRTIDIIFQPVHGPWSMVLSFSLALIWTWNVLRSMQHTLTAFKLCTCFLFFFFCFLQFQLNTIKQQSTTWFTLNSVSRSNFSFRFNFRPIFHLFGCRAHEIQFRFTVVYALFCWKYHFCLDRLPRVVYVWNLYVFNTWVCLVV